MWDIASIIPQKTKDAVYVFIVRLVNASTNSTVDCAVGADDLTDYQRLQNTVAANTGALYRCFAAEGCDTHQASRAWRILLAEHLEAYERNAARLRDEQKQPADKLN